MTATHLTGDITTFLAALGRPEPDPAVQAVLERLGGSPDVESFSDGPGRRGRYLSFPDAGVELLVEQDLVEAVFVHLTDHEDGAAHADPAALVVGWPDPPDREAVRALLGAPLGSSEDPAWDLFALDDRFANVSFDLDGSVTRVTLVATEPTVLQTAPRPVTPAGTIEPPFGGIEDFIESVGELATDDVLHLLVVVTGTEPGMSSEVEERDGVEWLSVGLRGVDLRLRDGWLASAVVHVSPDREAHPSPGDLVDGLPLPASRDTAHQALGVPAGSDDTSDLWHLAARGTAAGRDLDLRIDYRDEQTIALAIVQRGVDLSWTRSG
ncbi:hypothetical protein [Nocardioides litoris]|uniref:hypothetical protein n=1 Tax=Nocardioides litoris TaxID=1926648 RepID=UPI00111DAD1A|nr:hypothetical protein [Nocardioides litoris]